MDEMQTMNENKELTIAQECGSVQSTVAGSFETIFEKLSPERIKTADDAQALVRVTEAAGKKFIMLGRRAMYVAYNDRLWETATSITGKPYKNFAEWAKRTVGLGSSQAYNAVAVGEYINANGKGTRLDRYGNAWEFTQLLTLLSCTWLFERDKEKQYHAKTMQAWEADTNDSGKQAAEVGDDGNVHLLWREKDGEMPIIDALMMMGAITSRMTVANIKERLRKQWAFDRYGAHGKDAKELTESEETESEETESESTESESAGERVTEKANAVDVGARLSECARAIMLYANADEPDLDKVREYAKYILAIAEKL